MQHFTVGLPDQERYTPPEIVVAVKETLGCIDLDPCTTKLVNSTFIRAKRWYSKEHNGLDRANSWTGRVFVNPPGGSNLPKHFWERIMNEYRAKQIHSAIFLAYDITQLQRSQQWDTHMLNWPFCIPKRALSFYEEKSGTLKQRQGDEFSSAIVYIGVNVRRFARAFDNIGCVIVPKVIGGTQNSTE